MVYSNNYGLNDNFEYLELALDSAEAVVSAEGIRVINPLSLTNQIFDNPLFQVAGRQPLRGIAAIKVLEAQIPFTWYTIRSGINGNNQFIIKYNTLERTVTIPEGNYTPAQLAAVLTIECDNSNTAIGFDVLWQFNDNLGKFETARSGGAMGANYTFIINNASLAAILGGQVGQQVWVNIAPSPFYVPMSFVAQISGPNYLYVNSNALGPNVNMYQPRTSFIGGNSGPQIAKIPVNVSPGGIIYWQDPDPQKWFSADNLDSLSNLDLYLSLGTSRDILQLNGAGFSIKLGLLLWISDATSYNTTARTMAKRE